MTGVGTHKPEQSRSGWYRLGRFMLGLALIGGGIVGLILPGLQGILMIAGGLYLLGVRWPWLERKYHAWRARRGAKRAPDISLTEGGDEQLS